MKKLLLIVVLCASGMMQGAAQAPTIEIDNRTGLTLQATIMANGSATQYSLKPGINPVKTGTELQFIWVEGQAGYSNTQKHLYNELPEEDEDPHEWSKDLISGRDNIVIYKNPHKSKRGRLHYDIQISAKPQETEREAGERKRRGELGPVAPGRVKLAPAQPTKKQPVKKD